jgi:hypothetical protein
VSYDDRSVKPDERELDARAHRDENFIRSLRRCANFVDERDSINGRVARGKSPFRTAVSIYHRCQSGLVQRFERRQTGRERKLDLVWLNPSIIPSMAVRGVGPFKNKSPLRALAVFPSWDRLVIAVSPRLGVHSWKN